MVRVTSEVAANTSFQNAAAKSARPDTEPSSGNDRFAAMVDSNTAASRNDRAPDPAPAPRRSDNSQPASDSRPRDNAAPDRSDRAARNNANDRNTSIRADGDRTRSDNDAKADGDTSAKNTTRRGKSRPEAEKSDRTEASDAPQSASDGSSVVSGQTDTAQDGTATPVANTLAAVIPDVSTPATPATPATDTKAPLAIAAAAIAATATIAAETAPVTDTSAKTAAAATTEEEVATGAGTQTGSAQTGGDPAAMAEPALDGDAALAASANAANPAAAKQAALLKHADTARKSATTIVEPSGPVDSADTTTQTSTGTDTATPSVTPSHEAAAKPKSEAGAIETVKADASGNSAIPAPPNPGAHAAADISLTTANAPANGLPVPGSHPSTHVTTPAAASQLTATAAASGAVPVSGLAMEIAASVKSGKTSFEIRLDPAELGRIDVRIDIDRHGQVTSHLTVERAETLSTLRQDANQLQRALDNAGLQTGNNGLQFSLRDQSSQGQHDNNQSHPNAQRLVIHEEESVPAVVAGRSYGRMLGASGGVDIRI